MHQPAPARSGDESGSHCPAADAASREADRLEPSLQAAAAAIGMDGDGLDPLLASAPVAGAVMEGDDDMCRMSSVRDTPVSSVATIWPSKGPHQGRSGASGSSRGAKGAAQPSQGSPAGQIASAAVGGERPAAGPKAGSQRRQRKPDPRQDGIPPAASATSPPLPKPR